MLSGLRIFTTDNVWRQILNDLGAVVTTDNITADTDIDSLNITEQISPVSLKSLILKSVDENNQKIINKIFGKSVNLPRLQMQIIVLLERAGQMSAEDLKSVLGYSPDIATHTVDTAIYNLRKTYGRDFVKYENGKYSIGKL